MDTWAAKAMARPGPKQCGRGWPESAILPAPGSCSTAPPLNLIGLQVRRLCKAPTLACPQAARLDTSIATKQMSPRGFRPKQPSEIQNNNSVRKKCIKTRAVATPILRRACRLLPNNLFKANFDYSTCVTSQNQGFKLPKISTMGVDNATVCLASFSKSFHE